MINFFGTGLWIEPFCGAGEENPPEFGDSLAYVLGARGHFGTPVVDPNLGHAVVIQRIDTRETWMGAWKDGIQSWNDINVFGQPNKANPSPYSRWSNWKYEPDTPADQLGDRRIKWQYNKPEMLQRLKWLKDNLKYLPKGQKPIVNPNEVREEFEWLHYYHLREVASHPLRGVVPDQEGTELPMGISAL